MSHLREVILGHLRRTVGILVADHMACIPVDQGIPADKRTLHHAAPATVKAAWCHGSYAMAVLLCPGSDTKALAAFAAANRLDPDRVHFYAASGTDVLAALAAWRQAGFHVHSILDVKDAGAINRHFGAHWNHIIHDELCTRPGCVLHLVA